MYHPFHNQRKRISHLVYQKSCISQSFFSITIELLFSIVYRYNLPDTPMIIRHCASRRFRYNTWSVLPVSVLHDSHTLCIRFWLFRSSYRVISELIDFLSTKYFWRNEKNTCDRLSYNNTFRSYIHDVASKNMTDRKATGLELEIWCRKKTILWLNSIRYIRGDRESHDSTDDRSDDKPCTTWISQSYHMNQYVIVSYCFFHIVLNPNYDVIVFFWRFNDVKN